MSDYVYTQEELFNMISLLLGKYNAESALLFGSYARKEATSDSDIDLLVFGGKNFEPTDIFSLAEELYKLSGKRVDVYEICEIEENSPFYNSIMREGVKIA